MSRKNLIKVYRYVAFFVLLWLGALVSGCAPSEHTYTTLSGDRLALSDFHGKVVFINYWAEWCRPCRGEIPEFNIFSDQRVGEVKVFSVNFDSVSGADLAEQVSGLGIEFDTLLADPRSELGAPSVVALPETLVIGRQGKLFKVLLGPQTLEQLNEVFLSVP